MLTLSQELADIGEGFVEGILAVHGDGSLDLDTGRRGAWRRNLLLKAGAVFYIYFEALHSSQSYCAERLGIKILMWLLSYKVLIHGT